MGQAVTSPYCPSLDESSLILFSFFNKGIKKHPVKKKRSSGRFRQISDTWRVLIKLNRAEAAIWKEAIFPRKREENPSFSSGTEEQNNSTWPSALRKLIYKGHFMSCCLT